MMIRKRIYHFHKVSLESLADRQNCFKFCGCTKAQRNLVKWSKRSGGEPDVQEHAVSQENVSNSVFGSVIASTGLYYVQ